MYSEYGFGFILVRTYYFHLVEYILRNGICSEPIKYSVAFI